MYVPVLRARLIVFVAEVYNLSYQDGVELDPYRQSRTHDLLSQYIDTVSTRYARRSVLASSQADSQIPKLGGGETGEVVKLDAAGLDRIKREGGFVKVRAQRGFFLDLP